MAALSPLSRGAAGPRRRWRAAGAAGWGERLARALVARGPIAARLGVHLGARIDLFPGTDCLRLLEIPDHGPGSAPARVAELFASELGGRPEDLFDDFEPQPFASGLASQWHRARLSGGTAVVVELAHPELVPELAAGEPGPVTERLIAAGELPPAAREAAEDLVRQLDLAAGCLPLEQLADETSESRWIEAPRTCPSLCTPRIRVLEDPAGRLAAAPAAAGGETAAGAARARRLARGWLGLALGGQLFPAEPWGGNLRHLPDGRTAFLGGAIHRLPRAVLPELREYLAAVAARMPARAALAFLDLLREPTTDRRLRDRLRHTDPFRDPGLDVGGDLFARQLLAHWRTASEYGRRLPEGLVPFYRGLFLLNQEMRRLSPDTAPLRDGFREARLLLLFDELRDEAESGRWSGGLEGQLSAVSALPQKLDRILTLAAEDGGGADSAARSDGRDESRSGAWPVMTACLLALTAVALLSHHLAAATAAGAWAERLGALAVLLLGALLLAAATRDGPD